MNDKLFAFFVYAFIFLLGSVFIVRGQSAAPITSSGAKVGEKFYDMRNRANELTRVREELSRPDAKTPDASFPVIKKDFEQLQLINTEKLQKNSTVESLNYKIIVGASRELNEHALKLKTTLFPFDETAKKPFKMPEKLTAEDFAKILIALDNSIYRFVSNPIFQNTKLVKPEDSENAQKELNKIILISEVLQSGAKKMK